jgi:hypothetical protein
MKTRQLIPVAIVALLAPAIRASAQSQALPVSRDTLVLRQSGVRTAERVPGGIGTLGTSAPHASYSVELSQIPRLAGLSAFYRGAVDITNNTTNGGVVARIQYSYANAACPNGFCRTQVFPITLAGLDNFHSDDMVQFLNDQGLLVPGAVDDAVGTLLITFDNLPDNTGWEGTAQARIYTRVDEANPALGTIGYAFPASLFFESAHETTLATIRDTAPAALSGGTQGSQRTNIGVRNTDINGSLFPGSNRAVTAQATFYDVTPGSPTEHQLVGNALTFPNLVPGQVALGGNVFSLAQIPDNVSEAIVFVDVVSPTPSASSPTIEAFAIVIDNTTQDGSYIEMKCGDVSFVCGQ